MPNPINSLFIDYILENLRHGETLLEFGSGPTTRLLTEKYTVYSIEHNPKWIGHAPKSHYTLSRITSYPSGNSWYDVKSFPEFPKYDMVLVDGPLGTIGRKELLNQLHLFDTTVPWIFDDVNRSAEGAVSHRFAEIVGRPETIYQHKLKNYSVI